ncbi:hypothetical protein CFC21_007778 [Triticum aestivum]|uniref:Uncharacterized protein n=2 Tax=Triticum aestivum TaxID=4565 RepID=A0A9R1DET7_WHEAT|nr:hypothetical protein CFC21_007778 [Triticum aestivum]
MEIVTARSGYDYEGQEQQQHRGRRRRKPSDGHVVAQLLDSPLPTPRRSCCGSAAGTPRSARAASPQRTHVPFSWESSPGVPKAGGASLERGWLPPRPPPGRGGRAYHGGNTTTDATSSDDDDDTFSDALDRISSSDRLAALSARLSSIDGRAASRRLSSFIMDRFLPAANAIARTSTEKRAKKSPRRAARRSEHHDDEEDEAPATARLETHTPRRERHVPAIQQEEESWNGTPPQEIAWRHEEEARGDETPPRSCGFTVLFPWCVKPVLCGFPWSPARPRHPRASPPRRSTTMGDVLVKELGLRNGDPSHWYEEKSSGSGKEWSSPGGPGLGMSILGTSKRYCADARKALSRLARSAADGGGGGSPRMSRERRSGKAASSPLHSTSGRMPQLQLQVKPPSESWLCHARGSNAVNSKR